MDENVESDTPLITPSQYSKILVGISSCLLGERVRFDGGHKKNSYIIDTLGQYFEYKPFCPEMAIGLGVPRETIRLVSESEGANIVVRGTKNNTLDVTNALINTAEEQRHWHADLFGYIVKKDSPSCGMERVKIYRNGQVERKGIGRYTQTLMENFPELPVEEEGRLGDSGLRENFVQRVFVYQRWREMMDNGINKARLTDFHARHKLIMFSHNQNLARDLGRELATIDTENIESYAKKYIATLMQLLKIVATPSNHVNTLEHIRGYLKHNLDSSDKQELTESIENYRLGLLPLVVPITLLRHHFRKNPDPYIEKSWYLQPHPQALMLLNTL